MKILYISDFLYGDLSGANTAAKAHLNTLKEIAGEKNVDVIALTGCNNIDCEDITFKSYSNKLLLYINSFLGYTTYMNSFIVRKILKIIQKGNYNIIFIDNSIYGKLSKKIKIKFPEKIVFSFYHDVKQELCKSWKNKSPWYKKKVYDSMMSNELINQRYCDINITLNNRESYLYEKYYKKSPEAELSIYMKIDEKLINNKMETIGETLKILFVGGYYYPNVNGITWFVNNIESKINIPIELTIIGNGMEKLSEVGFPSWVRIFGRVESLAEYYEKCDLVIEPIFEGGGMKVKTAEALGYGKMILATKESLIGYLENIPKEYLGRLVYECEIIDDFVEALNNVYRNRQYLYKYNKELREIFNKHYSNEYAKILLSNLIEKYKK
ncbi:MAG: glycosyltransferase family 4 protein [Clostridium baratii]|uniref:glycosyltransferase n=1 Tax=Clostridium baratii TaxID=1561 RepID=UPI00242B512F|nr:glycosyltransferase [Clostridium baratii]MBS6007238.1 glycosyltransferase family 4 protein [Clostridium baratii]